LLISRPKKEKRKKTDKEEEGKKMSDDFVSFVQSWLDCRTIFVNNKSESCFVWFFGVYFSSISAS
jgi:hypothetical protein